MRRHISAFCCLAFSLAAAARAEPVSVLQDQAPFEAALSDASAAPYFVLVTIVDDRTGKSWTGCTVAPSLDGAIHAENNLAYDGTAIARARQIMLAAKDHVFHFSNPAALAKIPMDGYAPADLDRARAYLHAHGTAFLLTSDWDKIDAANKLNRTALACAIIEKGLAARRSDGTAETFAEP
jgi:hypothetical protein